MTAQHQRPAPRATASPSLHLSLRRALLCGAVMLPLTLAASAYADMTAEHTYHLPQGDLSQVLTRFAAEAGVVLSFDANLTRGRQSPGLVGRYSTEAGLHQLLNGSGLQAVRESDGRYSLVPHSEAKGALELGATNVTGQRLGAITEDSGSYTTGTLQTATKLALSSRQTPQSVSVVTRQRMDDRGMQTLHDVVKDVPGLTLSNDGPERPTYYSRGFSVDNILYDGLPTTVASYTARDTIAAAETAMLDRVEVVRGATGLMTGSGSPSAAINLVRKRPTKEPRASISVGAGSWDNYRAELDASSALNGAGTVRGRAVTSYQVKNSFQDVVNKEHSLFYAISEIDLTDATLFTLGVSNQNLNNNTAWGGVPTGSDGRDLKLSRSTYLGNDWGRWDQDNNSVFAELEQRFDNDWKLRLAATKSWSKLDLFASYATAGANDTFNQMTGKFRYENDQSSYDAFASGPFQLLGREHELVVGASHRRETFEGHGTTVLTTSDIDIYNWNPHTVAKPAVNMAAWQQQSETEQTGTYLTGRFSLAEPLHLILGGRLDWYDYQIDSLGSATKNDKVTRNLTRYAGLIYDLNDTYSVYVSYTDIFSPQGVVDTSNSPIKPITGKNYEVGIKGEYFEGALNASAALYRIDQENRAAVTNIGCMAPAGTSCYVASGEVRSEGLELEVSGALTPDWQLAAGYTYNAAKYRKDAVASNEGTLFNSDLPRHLFKLNTTYTLPGALQRWRIGGGLTSQNTTFNKGDGYRIEQEGYTLVDMVAGYKATEHLDLRVNLNNVFDKKYYQSINSNTWNAFNVYGDPRNFMLSAKYSF